MKTMILAAAFFLTVVSLAPAVLAKPEQIRIKDPNKSIKERNAKAQIKNVNLQNIEDPEARRAIREIMNYLDLKTKN